MNYKIPTENDLGLLMDVISDVSFENQEKSKEIIKERISQGQILCAFEENKIAGFAGWNKNFDNNPAWIYLEQITIKKEYRGKGFGQKLLKNFIYLFNDRKIEKIFAHVQNHNEASMNLFVNYGWVVSENEKFLIESETFLEYKIKDRFEFWFRKEYEDLVINKKLTQFVRPGVRKSPDPKGTNVGEKVLVRIIEVPSLIKEEAVLNPNVLEADVVKLEPKKIEEMTNEDFIGTSPDADTKDGVISQLEKIYNTDFSKDDIVTVFEIRYE